jgi:hypothetical protein
MSAQDGNFMPPLRQTAANILSRPSTAASNGRKFMDERQDFHISLLLRNLTIYHGGEESLIFG